VRGERAGQPGRTAAATVVRRPPAALDILDAWDHVADDDLAAADRWVDGLDTAFGRLATQPLMGRASPEVAPGLRCFPLRRDVISCLPPPDGIDVVRALHVWTAGSCRCCGCQGSCLPQAPSKARRMALLKFERAVVSLGSSDRSGGNLNWVNSGARRA
jgi:toxin ParE1/3/4